jgi:hypothetical protein
MVETDLKRVRIIKNVLLPISLLWEYREFKRDETPAPRIPFVNMYDVEEVTEYVKRHGLHEPLELSIINSRALLTDGNHRLVAARRNGYEVVPVNIHIYPASVVNEVFYEHTLARFKDMNETIKKWLVPVIFSRRRKKSYFARPSIACIAS